VLNTLNERKSVKAQGGKCLFLMDYENDQSSRFIR